MKRVTIAGADTALQREELFGEPPKDLERSVLVVHEHVAPHGRVTGCDAGEITETGGRELDDLLVRHPAQIVRDTYHRVGDEVGNVADHSADLIVMGHVHAFGVGPERLPVGL